MNHNSVKSRRLAKLVKMSYDLQAEVTDDDVIFLEKTKENEKQPELKEALEDLEEFLFPW